jgi:hypothetical protein
MSKTLKGALQIHSERELTRTQSRIATAEAQLANANGV